MFVLKDIGFTFTDNQVQALEGINMQLAPGRIHAIIGENGAGKSTLARICTGHLRAGTGQLSMHGKLLRPGSPGNALAAGLALVPQHPRLAASLEVWQNLVLGTSDCPGGRRHWRPISRGAMIRDLQERLAEWQIKLPLEMPASQLDAAHMHWAAIAEALLANPRYLFLDEPSAPYSPDEVERLYRLLRRCTERGMMVAVITHRLQEVLDWVDEVHVLRHGRLVTEFAITAEHRIEDLLGPMFSQAPAASVQHSPPRTPVSCQGVPLRLSGLVTRDGPGRSLHGLDFSAPPGRISGLVGIKDQGLEILEDILSGMTTARSGSLKFGDRELSRMPRHDRGYIPGKRFARGIAPSLSIMDNAISRDRQVLFPRGFLSPQRRNQWRAASRFLLDRSWSQGITTLSGGMIQRLIFERELANPLPRLLICAEPWWGLDQQYQTLLLQRLRNLADGGCTVVVLSSDLDEAMACCDSLGVIRHGRIVLAQDKAAFDRNRLAAAMVHAVQDDPA